MAARSGNSIGKHAYRFFNTKSADPTEPTGAIQDEFDESEIWDGQAQLHSGSVHPVPKTRPGHKRSDQSRIGSQPGPSSLPVNIPDWSKILGSSYNNNITNNDYNNNDDFWGEESEVIPPHEYLCKNRVCSSFSVHEGAGRTLKGRDLSRVRDAVWEKTGFQD